MTIKDTMEAWNEKVELATYDKAVKYRSLSPIEKDFVNRIDSAYDACDAAGRYKNRCYDVLSSVLSAVGSAKRCNIKRALKDYGAAEAIVHSIPYSDDTHNMLREIFYEVLPHSRNIIESYLKDECKCVVR